MAETEKKKSRFRPSSFRPKSHNSPTGSGKAGEAAKSSKPVHDSVFEPTSIADHLVPFFPPSSPALVLTDHISDLEKLRSKLFGLPLIAGANFCLRQLPGSQPHIPLLVSDLTDWLVHYIHLEEKSVVSLITEEPDKGLFERLLKKCNKDGQPNITGNVHAPTVWNVLKSYIASLPETPVTFEAYSALIISADAKNASEILNTMPQENRSLAKRLLWLLEKFRDQTRNPNEEQLVISTFSQLLFNVTQPEYPTLNYAASLPSSNISSGEGTRNKIDKILGLTPQQNPLVGIPKRELLTSTMLHSILHDSSGIWEKLQDAPVPPLFRGELIIHRIFRVRVGSHFSDVTVWVTNFRIILRLNSLPNYESFKATTRSITPNADLRKSPSKKAPADHNAPRAVDVPFTELIGSDLEQDQISIPLFSIRHMEMIDATKKKRSKTITILMKDYSMYVLEMETSLLSSMLWDVLNSLVHPKSPLDTYPFQSFKFSPRAQSISSSASHWNFTASQIGSSSSKSLYDSIPPTQGWKIFDPIAEYQRLGIIPIPSTSQDKQPSTSKLAGPLFRISKLNAQYEVPTYPALWVVPTSIDDTEMKKFLPSRMRSRVPVVTWSSSNGAGVLLRADELDYSHLSDGKDTKSFHKVPADIKLIDSLASASKGKIIVDSGASKTFKYAFTGTNWQLRFLDSKFNNKTLAERYANYITFIDQKEKTDNIKSTNISAHISDGGSMLNAAFGIKAGAGIMSGVTNVLGAITETSMEDEWTSCIQNVISTASNIANFIESKNYAVLLTHSHGNDIDFVISSLVQIMIDGYYRSIKGIAVLLEKDWCAYGYDFSRKLGHQFVMYDEGTSVAGNQGSESPEISSLTSSIDKGATVDRSSKDSGRDDKSTRSGISTMQNDVSPSTFASIISTSTSDSTFTTTSSPEWSPFFDLFIEALWQLTLQYPLHFEFNETFLLSILESAYSCRFGTFLLNSEKEREMYVKTHTTSFWTHVHLILENSPAQFSNDFYDPETSITILDPRYDQPSLKVWYSKHMYKHHYAEMIAINNLVESTCSTFQTPPGSEASSSVHTPRSRTADSDSSSSTQQPQGKLSTSSRGLSATAAAREALKASNQVRKTASEQTLTDLCVKIVSDDDYSSVSDSSEVGPHPRISTSATTGPIGAETAHRIGVVGVMTTASSPNLFQGNSKLHDSEDASSSSHLPHSISTHPTLLKDIPTHSDSNDHMAARSQYASSLVELNLAGRFLKMIPASVLVERNASKIHSLNFSYNSLNFFPSDILRLTKLRRLNLSNNALGAISRDYFFMLGSHLAYLQQLDLSNTGLKDLPEAIASLSCLRILSVRRNKLTELPLSLPSLSKLEIFDARENRLSTLPPTFYKLPQLRVLALGDNCINLTDDSSTPPPGEPITRAAVGRNHSKSTTPPVQYSFKHLQNLQVLDWRANASKDRSNVPSTIFLSPNLTTLYLESNYIEALVPEIGKLSTLTHLNISDNDLVTLPEELTGLANLQTLIAAFNGLWCLPYKMNKLPLKTLNLSNNKFQELPPPVLQMTQLRHLDMSCNNIKTIPQLLVEKITLLQTLNLSDNAIYTLDNLAGFRSCLYLQHLILSGNLFERLSADLYHLEPTLITLDVDTSHNSRIIFPPRDILFKGKDAILRFLQERASMGEPDPRFNLIVIGDLPAHKSWLLHRLVRASRKDGINALGNSSSSNPTLVLQQPYQQYHHAHMSSSGSNLTLASSNTANSTSSAAGTASSASISAATNTITPSSAQGSIVVSQPGASLPQKNSGGGSQSSSVPNMIGTITFGSSVSVMSPRSNAPIALDASHHVKRRSSAAPAVNPNAASGSLGLSNQSSGSSSAQSSTGTSGFRIKDTFHQLELYEWIIPLSVQSQSSTNDMASSKGEIMSMNGSNTSLVSNHGSSAGLQPASAQNERSPIGTSHANVTSMASTGNHMGSKVMQTRVDARAKVWEINLSLGETRAFLHPAFLSERTVYIVSWDISTSKESLWTWLELMNLKHRKMAFMVIGFGQSSSDFPSKESLVALEAELKSLHAGYKGIVFTTPGNKADLKNILTKVEEAVSDLACSNHEIFPVSYYTMERFLTAQDSKPPIMSYEYFTQVAKDNGIKDMKKLMKHLMGLGIAFHILDHPYLSNLILLDPFWPFLFIQHTAQARTIHDRGIIQHSDLPGIMPGDKRYPKNIFPILIAFQYALGLVQPLSIETSSLQLNLNQRSSDVNPDSAEAIDSMHFTKPSPNSQYTFSANSTTTVAPSLDSDLNQGDSSSIRNPTRNHSKELPAQYLPTKGFIPPLFQSNYFWKSRSFVPSLIDDLKPAALASLWPPFVPLIQPSGGELLQVGRIYTYHVVPAVLFHKLLTRIMAFVKVSLWWRSGCIIQNESSGESILVQFAKDRRCIEICTRTSKQITATIDIYEALDHLTRSMKMELVHVRLPCPHCAAAAASQHYASSPHPLESSSSSSSLSLISQASNPVILGSEGTFNWHFTLAECEAISSDPNAYLFCHDIRPIALKYIAPDLYLPNIVGANQPVIPYTDLDMVKLIGEGAAAEVFLANLGQEKVAVKRLRILKKSNKTSSDLHSSSDLLVRADHDTARTMAEFRREIRFLSTLKHASVVGFRGIVLDPPCIIQEYCGGGNLYEFCHTPAAPGMESRIYSSEFFEPSMVFSQQSIEAASISSSSTAVNVGHTLSASSSSPTIHRRKSSGLFNHASGNKLSSTPETPHPSTLTFKASQMNVTWPLRLKIALDIAEAISVMHSNPIPITHRDLKSPNILLQIPSMSAITAIVQQWYEQMKFLKPDSSSLTPSDEDSPVSKRTSPVLAASMPKRSTSSVLLSIHTQGSNNPSSETANKLPSSSSVPSPSSPALAARKEVSPTPSVKARAERLNKIEQENSTAKRAISPFRASSSASVTPDYHLNPQAMKILQDMKSNAWALQPSIAKVTDFGLTGFTPIVSGREVDNPVWLAPEIMAEVDYTEKADVYSFGVIMYELLTCKEYFGHIGFMTDIEALILAGKRPQLVPLSQIIERSSSSQSSLELTENSSTHSSTAHKYSVPPAPKLSSMVGTPRSARQLASSSSVSLSSSKYREGSSSSMDLTNLSAVAVKSKIKEDEELKNLPLDLWQVPEFIYLMEHCWADSHIDRPSFKDITACLRQIISSRQELSAQINTAEPANIVVPMSNSSVVPSQGYSMISDLLPNTVLIEHMDVGESVNTMASLLGQVWIGFSSGTVSSFSTISPKLRSTASTLEDSSSSHSAELDSSDGSKSKLALGTPPKSAASTGDIPASSDIAVDNHDSILAQGSSSFMNSSASTAGSFRSLEINVSLLGTFRHHKTNVSCIVPFLSSPCSTSIDRQITLWSIGSGNVKDKFKLPNTIQLEPPEEAITAMIGVDNMLFAVHKSGSLGVYDHAQLKWKERKYGIGALNSVLHIPTTNHMWLGGEKKIVRLDPSMKVLDTMSGHEGAVTTMICTGHHVWTGSADKMIRVWDSFSGSLQQVLFGHKDEITCLLQVGSQVWSTGKDKSIMIWDRHHFTLLKEIPKAHKDIITSLVLVQNQEVWSGSSDRTVGRWTVSEAFTQFIHSQSHSLNSSTASFGFEPISHSVMDSDNNSKSQRPHSLSTSASAIIVQSKSKDPKEDSIASSAGPTATPIPFQSQNIIKTHSPTNSSSQDDSSSNETPLHDDDLSHFDLTNRPITATRHSSNPARPKKNKRRTASRDPKSTKEKAPRVTTVASQQSNQAGSSSILHSKPVDIDVSLSDSDYDHAILDVPTIQNMPKKSK